ncbi:7155_t:CDS:2 [Scutellospora calospora]|uniref:7155_t:CDS:1 n=1 Tax=Scutellospora calospora TaxID=85575 RepID=A0ACA9KY36_9GLOM|nr:7155_t:CDS:2 [Scutellospora calospora]
MPLETQENISVNDLLVETLIREAKLNNLFELTEVPLKFLTLVEICIIRKEHEAELSTTNEHDEPNSLCCLIALDDFESSELCFPQLQIVVKLKPGQVVAFSSHLLLHIYNDLEEGIKRNTHRSIVLIIPCQDLNNTQKQGHISLVYARHGLRAEDSLPNL